MNVWGAPLSARDACQCQTPVIPFVALSPISRTFPLGESMNKLELAGRTFANRKLMTWTPMKNFTALIRPIPDRLSVVTV